MSRSLTGRPRWQPTPLGLIRFRRPKLSYKWLAHGKGGAGSQQRAAASPE
jgi:hypothetical protein